MRRLAVAVLVVFSALLVATSVAYSKPQHVGTYPGFVVVKIRGWGSVTLGRGFARPHTLVCIPSSCPRTVRLNVYQTTGPRATLTERGRFAVWRGSCSGRKRTCVINLSRVRPASYGARWAHVRALFAA